MRTVNNLTLAAVLLAAFSMVPSWAEDSPEIGLIKSAEEFQLEEPGEEADEQIGKILGLADKTAVVQLDWMLHFAGGPDAHDCGNGRVTDYNEPYRLPMNLASTHFVMSVIPGSPWDFPFNSVSCTMTGGEDFVIRIAGFYVISRVDIPTANDVELRPVSPFALIAGPAE